jgi:hypothetical protein
VKSEDYVMSDIQPIDPVSDERIEHKTATLNGQTYHYLYAVPKDGEYTGTVFLVCIKHWRNAGLALL